eukprot:TRINITY_DN1438_c0_g2_i2.p1 TRINITY_DN1438_c0_g2~~TRINITY_DN1438_c0_g2_i2.p1  ORF type:complete len:293 (-),score=2.53 TRINITY_DN1438_c0_g2_i2:151-1029(-)
MEIQTITVAVIVILVMFLILRPRRKRIANFYGEAVLISGASSGLGREIALNLSERGFVVFAGYRKNEDREALLAANEARKPQGKLIPVQLDVTKEEDISAVFKTVSEYVGSKGLLGLINNAGVFHDPAQPSEHIPLEEWRRVFEVNLFGVVRMSQVFLPLLLANQHKGRLCNMSSPAGAVHLPFFGPYCATKAALESTTNVFRLELLKNNVHVVTFSPAALEVSKLFPRSYLSRSRLWSSSLWVRRMRRRSNTSNKNTRNTRAWQASFKSLPKRRTANREIHNLLRRPLLML